MLPSPTQLGLELNLDKTRIVYCKDSNRIGSPGHERFTFLRYTFRPRRARGRGELFDNFLPAVSDDAAKEIRGTIKRWRLHLWSGKALDDLAREINSTVRCRINYYGSSTGRIRSLSLIDECLVRWAMRKYSGCADVPDGRAGSWRQSQRDSQACSSIGSGCAAHGRMMGAR